jgi:hypothetical protein
METVRLAAGSAGATIVTLLLLAIQLQLDGQALVLA